MGIEDARLTRRIWREIYKRSVDSSRLRVRSVHGVIYIDGELRRVRGLKLDLNKEWELIEDIIRRIREVRDVVAQVKLLSF